MQRPRRSDLSYNARKNSNLCGNVNAEDLLAGRKRAVVRESEQTAHIRLRRDKTLDS